jgi:type IV pilus assembly protein PilY1
MERAQKRVCKASVRSKIRLGMIAGLLAFSAGDIQAGPGEISQLPLFLGTPVQPNIFFLLDNSGSMDWEVLMSAEAIEIHNAGYWDNAELLDFDPGTNGRNNLEHCVGYNVLAYNPEATYTPWAGFDVNGNAFGDQSVTNAMVNPYTGATNNYGCHYDGVVINNNGRTCNLLTDFNDNRVSGKKGAFYIPWKDDGDGVYQDGECSRSATDRVYIQDVSDQWTNYANWFSYYRKREYVMKRAVSEIVANTTERMGFATINRNGNVSTGQRVGTPVKDLDDLTVPINATAAANKKTMLHNLLGVNSKRGTWLRTGLNNVGLYFMDQMNSHVLFGVSPSDDADSASGHSPILNADLGGTCQQNFAIVMSDGYWNGDDPESIGGVSGLTNTDIDGDGPFDGQSYGDSVKLTLADIAMHYYETDLIPDDDVLADEVPPVDILIAPGDGEECSSNDALENPTSHPNCYDTNSAQHLVTYTVAFGVSGSIPIKDAAGKDCVPPSRDNTTTEQNWPKSCDSSLGVGWPTPVEDENTTVDDMRHAAWNGRGLFLNASDPNELIKSLQEAIEDIEAKNPVAAAAVAVDSASIVGGGNVVQGKFNSNYWTGELYSYAVELDEANNNQPVVSAAPTWAAHDELDAAGYSARTAVTYNGTKGIPFKFPVDYTSTANFGDTEISQAQLNDLMVDAPYSLTTTDEAEITANQEFGESIVNFLLGDHSNETDNGGDFRTRKGHKLGDIIHSAPVYVGDPDSSLYYESSYQSWANDEVPNGAKGRQGMIYIGANDGGLHAFDATTGEEVFVYFPEAVFSTEERAGLHYLADRGYEHHYYVDGDITVAEVYADFDGTGDKWSTVLIGALRGGGRAIYAIDISDPTEFETAAGVASNILWEFSNDELGFTFGKSTVAKMNNGRWAAIFGNGYNPGSAASGEAALFIKYLDSDKPTYDIISTGVGSNAASDCLSSSSDCNGLSTPAVVDLGADNVADRAYAGDVKGNLWAFDLSAANATSWGLAYSATPLFTAVDENGVAQPITTQPAVIMHPTVRHENTSPNTMLYFGTGQYVTETDPANTNVNSFYGLWDAGSAITKARDKALVEQTITQDKLGEEDIRIMTNNPVDYTTARGWFVDLPDSGERVIANALAFGEIVVYNTIVPKTNLCSISGGYSWLMVHSLSDGSEPDFIALDVSGDGSFDENDQKGDKNVTGVRSGELNWQITLTKSGPGSEVTAFIPAEDLDTQKILGGRTIGTRSSWGRYNTE